MCICKTEIEPELAMVVAPQKEGLTDSVHSRARILAGCHACGRPVLEVPAANAAQSCSDEEEANRSGGGLEDVPTLWKKSRKLQKAQRKKQRKLAQRQAPSSSVGHVPMGRAASGGFATGKAEPRARRGGGGGGRGRGGGGGGGGKKKGRKRGSKR